MRSRAPLKTAKTAQAGAKRVGMVSEDKKEEIIAFYPVMEGALPNSLLPV